VILGQKGENAIQDFVSKSGVPVFSVVGIRDVVEYIYKEEIPVMIEGKRTPIDAKIKAQFDKYLETYGIR